MDLVARMQLQFATGQQASSSEKSESHFNWLNYRQRCRCKKFEAVNVIGSPLLLSVSVKSMCELIREEPWCQRYRHLQQVFDVGVIDLPVTESSSLSFS
jgi:hypothetical protein